MIFVKNKRGFSLVELIVAISILAVLSAVLVPSFLHMTKESKESKDNMKFQSMCVVFERTLSEKEVLINLEKNQYFNNDPKNSDDKTNNTIYICFKIQEKGIVDLENGSIFYKNGSVKASDFKKSKIWLNAYQSLEKKYQAEDKNNFNKFLLFKITPKTLTDVASCNYQVVSQESLPERIKGNV